MKKKLYVVYDSKGEFYNGPLVHNTRWEALRAFGDAANDDQSMLAKHPEDYTLLEVGTFDPQTGTVEGLQAKVSLGSAEDARKAKTEMQPVKVAQ